MSLLNLDEELRLYSTNAQRERSENYATLFGLIVSLEYLERSYVRDSVGGKDYTPACTKLLAQLKSLLKLLSPDLSTPITLNLPSPPNSSSSSSNEQTFTGLEGFLLRYNLHCPAAKHRMEVGVPATSFITTMDALKLSLRAKDQLHPFLTELMGNYSRFSGSAEWEGRGKLVGWLIELNSMNASQEITEEQSRQMLFDIENAYNEFFRSLSSSGRRHG